MWLSQGRINIIGTIYTTL